MEEAVLAFLDYKYAEGRGTFRDGGAVTGWRDGAAVQAGNPSLFFESHRGDHCLLPLRV